MVKRLGELLLEDIRAHTATPCYFYRWNGVNPPYTKLMIGICRARNIVTKQWLLDSLNEAGALPCDDFLV
jgi:hypothetical protein